MLSYTEENYLKAIYHLSNHGNNEVNTNAIADALNTKAASVSDMLKKLSTKKVINYEKYYGVRITAEGKKQALHVIRKHRLWEVFLVQKLKFHWDEVHEIAEQLEHIQSPLLIERLDEFLAFPQFDPHGDPIPTADGQFKETVKVSLSEMLANETGSIVAVKESTPAFLQYLDKIGIHLGIPVKILSKEEYDGSMEITINDSRNLHISKEVANNLFVSKS